MRQMSTLVIVVLMFCVAGCSTLGKAMGKYGYNELRPPSRLVPPGTVVEVLSQNPDVLDIVCEQSTSLGSDFAVPSSPTYNQDLVQAVSKTFDIDADYLKKIKADAKFSSVKNIKLTVSNASVSQLSADAVYASVVHRTDSCQRAIDDYLKDNRKVSMVTSILQADVHHEVEFETKAGGNAQVDEELLKGLAVKLGAQYSNTGREEITGEGLFWGIRNDYKLALVRNDRTALKSLLTKDSSVHKALDQNVIDALSKGVTDTLLGVQEEISIIPTSAVVEIKSDSK